MCDASGTTSLPSSMQLHQLIAVNNFHHFKSTTGGVNSVNIWADDDDSDCQTEDDNASGWQQQQMKTTADDYDNVTFNFRFWQTWKVKMTV